MNATVWVARAQTHIGCTTEPSPPAALPLISTLLSAPKGSLQPRTELAVTLHTESQAAPTCNSTIHQEIEDRWNSVPDHKEKGLPRDHQDLVQTCLWFTSRQIPRAVHFCFKFHLSARKSCRYCSASFSPAPSRAWVWSGDMQGPYSFSTTGHHRVTCLHFIDEFLNSSLGIWDRGKKNPKNKQQQQ